MLEDIVGDYKDKTVTLEDFPFYDLGVKMASVHPCKHASVMKVLLDRADGALKIRKAKIKAAGKSGASGGASGAAENAGGRKVEQGMEGLVDDMRDVQLEGKKSGVAAAGGAQGDEWEVLEDEEDEVAIRVDQYLVVFLKFISSISPGIEHDFTMGV